MTTSLVFFFAAVASVPTPVAEAPAPLVVAEPKTVASLDLAEKQLDEGAALEAVAALLAEQRAPAGGALSDSDRARMSNLLGRAADVLASNGAIKAAAVAADAGWLLEGRPVRPRVSLLLGRYAASVQESEPDVARAIAERALVADPDNSSARTLDASLRGADSWVNGHLTLGGGVGLAVLSSSAFVYGLDVERQARVSVHDTAAVDALLLRRGVAAGVAWPAAVGAVVATGLGLALIMSHDPGPEPLLPSPFVPLPATDAAAGQP